MEVEKNFYKFKECNINNSFLKKNSEFSVAVTRESPLKGLISCKLLASGGYNFAQIVFSILSTNGASLKEIRD